MTLVTVGTCTIQATQAGNANYAAATPVNQGFQVTQESQTITFGALSNQALGTAPFTLSATASSGLAVSFASTTPAVCTVSGATVTLVAVGTCTIQATQAGNANYAAATPVNQSFQVTQESQPITFAFAETYVGNGLSGPWGVAVDAAGDVFIADTQSSRVVEVPAGGGPQTTVGSGLNRPYGVAVDAAGDVFIADEANNQVVEVPAGGGSQTTVPASGLNSPYGVAVDRSGDVFIADTGNNRVVEVPAGGGPQTTVGSGLQSAFGVAVDAAGDVFIADYAGNQVVEVPAGGGPQTTVGSGLSEPLGVAVDAAGDVFIADNNATQVVEVPAGGGSQTTVGSGLSYPSGVAVDGAGDVFVAGTSVTQVVEVQRVAVNFGNVNVCPAGQTAPTPCNQTLTLNYNVGASTTFGTSNVVTQGTPNLDFTLSSGSTCTGTVSAGSTCTVNVTFAPLAPGGRMGAVQLTDNLGNLLVTTMVHGVGQGPAIAFVPGVQTTVPASGLTTPFGVAVDAAGDVFIADNNNNWVVEIPAGGGPQTTVASGLFYPRGVAVDGAGDVFIADQGNNSVVEVPVGGGPQTTVGSGLGSPYGVAVDGAGDIFIADTNNSRVVEVPAGGGAQTTVGSGLNQPYGVAVDGAGDVFIADTLNSRVVEVPAGGGTQTTVGSGLNRPYGVAVDGAGDVFIVDQGNSSVVEVPVGGGAQTTVDSGLNQPTGVAVDGAGDVFIANHNNGLVVEVQRSQPPSLSFAATAVGNTSTDSPQSVTVQNIGNQLLDAVAPGLNIGANSFVQVPGSGNPADCNSSVALAPGASCNLSVSFIPQMAGSIVSAATFTDNALNATAASQSVALQGTGTQGSQTITFGALSNQALGTAPFTLSATASSGLAVSFASTTPAVCTVSGATVTLVAVGTCTIQATQAGNANYAAATPVNQSFQVTQESQTITFGALSNQALGTAPFALSATASSGLAVSFASTAPAVCTVSGATVTLVTVGTCTIQATQAGNANYAAATPVNQSFQVTQESQTITFGALSNQALGTAPFTLSATASSGLRVSFNSQTTGVCTVSGTTVTLVAVGTCTIQATQAGNANYAAATPVNQSFQVTQESQTITFGALSNQALGTAPFTLSATASSGLAVSFASTTPAVCTVSGATVTLVAVGTCTIQATQAGNANYAAATPVNQSFQVTQESQTITFGALSNQALGTAPFTLSATASSGLRVSFNSQTTGVCTVSGTTVTPVAVGTCTVQATQAGNANYAAAMPVNQGFQVTQESQTITFGALSNQALGTAPFTLSATATSGLAVSFASTTPAVCTVSGATVTLVAVGTCTIQAMQAGNANYAAATPVSQSFQVNAASFTLTSNPSSMTVAAGQPVTFTLKVTPQGSFTSPISFSCSGLPAQANCRFNPATVTPDASTVTSTVTITTTARTASLVPAPFGRRSSPVYAMWLMLPAMLLGTGMAAPKRRKLLSCFLVFLLVSGCLLQVACGTASNSGGGGGTPAGSYTITITGAAASTQHTAAVTLTVQ